MQVEGEPELSPSWMMSIDGNSSAKRYTSAGTADPRIFSSPYFLPRDVVDVMKDEVKGKPSSKDDDGEDDDDDNDNDGPSQQRSSLTADPPPGDLTDGEDKQTECTERWKAAAGDKMKGAFDAFDSTGIFGGVCRHGFIVQFCEMWRSGEL